MTRFVIGSLIAAAVAIPLARAAVRPTTATLSTPLSSGSRTSVTPRSGASWAYSVSTTRDSSTPSTEFGCQRASLVGVDVARQRPRRERTVLVVENRAEQSATLRACRTHDRDDFLVGHQSSLDSVLINAHP